MYEIDKSIPIPEVRKGSFGIYNFGDMQVGDSMLVEGDSDKIDSAKSASRGFCKRHGKKFRTMQVDGGVRIWRVE